MAELEDAIGAFEDLKTKSFNDPSIDVGALVELDQDGDKSFYFIGPFAGGTEITVGAREVLVITPQSPLGSQLQGQQQGGRLELALAGAKHLIQIVNVC